MSVKKTTVNKPKRPYEIAISIGADNLIHLVDALESIQYNILELRNSDENKKLDRYITTSGSAFFGYSLEIVKTETADHAEYFRQIVEVLKETEE